MIYLQLFFEFFKTGLFSIGGGLATLPFLKEMALQYPWFTPEDLLNMIAVSESTPGPLGINCATYAGFHAAGILGALVSTFSLVLPSVIIIMLISKVLTRFSKSVLVQRAFYGLRPASAGLILGAMVSVFAASFLHQSLWNGFSSLLSVINWQAVGCFAVFLVLIRLLPKIHPIVFIALGAVVGILFQF